MPLNERARQFVVPYCDDLQIIDAAYAAIAAHIDKADRMKALVHFSKRIVNVSDELRDLFTDTATFYMDLARGEQRYQSNNDQELLSAFPARELIRVWQNVDMAAWREFWSESGGRIYDDRMIASAFDPVWGKLSILGRPYPPFQFRSGVDWREVGLDEWEKLRLPRKAK